MSSGAGKATLDVLGETQTHGMAVEPKLRSSDTGKDLRGTGKEGGT